MGPSEQNPNRTLVSGRETPTGHLDPGLSVRLLKEKQRETPPLERRHLPEIGG